jgi:hypothetical protein
MGKNRIVPYLDFLFHIQEKRKEKKIAQKGIFDYYV